MRWISSPNSYRNINIISKHSWKKNHSIHIHFSRRSSIKTQPNQTWAAFLFSKKRRKEMITMLSTYTHKEQNARKMHPMERQFVLSSVIALFRFAPTVVLLRNQHGLQITKILFITNLLADQRGHYPIFAGNTACISLLFPAISILLFYSWRGAKRWNCSLCVAFCTLTNPERLPNLLEG